jgi:hypothetical protein
MSYIIILHLLLSSLNKFNEILQSGKYVKIRKYYCQHLGEIAEDPNQQ